MLRQKADPVPLLLALKDLPVTLEDDVGFSGGGALPMQELPGQVVVLRGVDASAVAAALRAHEPPVIARVADDSVRLDPRTLLPGDEVVVAEALHAALSTAKGV
jgi:L-seryl-tRNA(Ser) seleniumtransferase